MEISIFGVEAVLNAEGLIKKMETDKRKVTNQNLERLGYYLLQVRLSDYPHEYQVKNLEERYDALKEAVITH